MSDQARYAEDRRRHDEARKRLGNAVGEFCIEFALLEKYINWGISVLVPIGTHAKSDLLLGPIFSVDTRLNILESLIRGVRMSNDIRSELLKFVKGARQINGYRNWLLHGRWSGYHAYDDSWGKLRTKTKEKFERQWKNISPSEIIAEKSKIAPLVISFNKTMKLHRP